MRNEKNWQNGSSLCTHCSAICGCILIVKVVLELYRPGEKILWRCQPSSTNLGLVNFLKNGQKMVKNLKNQQNGSSLCTYCSVVYGGILKVKLVLELYRPGKKILWSCQPSSSKLAFAEFLKNCQKMVKKMIKINKTGPVCAPIAQPFMVVF